MRKLVDSNFHTVQTAWKYREKIGKLKNPNKKVAPSSLPARGAESPEVAIVVRPRNATTPDLS